MNLNDLTVAGARQLWSDLAPHVATRGSLEEAAGVLVRALCERFDDSIVLARAFVTIPFGALPPFQCEFAAQIARRAALVGALAETTPTLSLLASWGPRPEWRDRRSSRDDVAIPLISESFVDSVPVVSRLCKDLGLPLNWVEDHRRSEVREAPGADVGSLCVADVSDGRGKIISAQDFDSEHGIKSVFAVGGAYFGGSTFVLLAFCRHEVELEAARKLVPLVNLFKSVTAPRFSLASVFQPDRERHA